MKARVIVPLNIRTGNPEILPDNNTGDKYYNEGETIDISEIIIGEKYKDNSIWYKLLNGGFVWSGGVDDTDIKLHLKELTPLIPRFNYNQLIKNIPDNWRKSGGKGVKVIIMDTGIIKEHNDLKVAEENYFDYYLSPPGIFDIKGHGTQVAGIIAGNTTLNGIKGIAPLCELISFKTVSDTGSPAKTSILNSTNQLQKLSNENDILIINGSFSLNKSEELDLWFQNLPTNIIYISAGGNNDLLFSDTILFPANLRNIIAVGFINNKEYGEIKKPFNKSLDYVYIGDSLLSTTVPPPNNYESFSRTSMATAIVTGIVALMISSIEDKRQIKVEDIKRMLNANFPLVGIKPNDFITIYKINE